MMKRAYDWMMRSAAHEKAPHVLFWVAFVESSIFPIPPDAMLIPMILANRAKAWVYAAICTVGSVIGGVVGYAIGYFLYETLGQWIIHVYGLGDKFDEFQRTWNDWGVWIILIKGLTPIPYKLVTIASGLVKFNLGAFIIASIITRGARFFLLAALLRQFGAPIREFIEKRLTLVTTGFAGVIVLGFVALHYL